MWVLKTTRGLYFKDLAHYGIDYVIPLVEATRFATMEEAARVGELWSMELRYVYPVFIEGLK